MSRQQVLVDAEALLEKWHALTDVVGVPVGSDSPMGQVPLAAVQEFGRYLEAALTTPPTIPDKPEPERETLAELLVQAQAGDIGVKLMQYPAHINPRAQVVVWRHGERGELVDGATVEDALRAALARLSASAPAAGGEQ